MTQVMLSCLSFCLFTCNIKIIYCRVGVLGIFSSYNSLSLMSAEILNQSTAVSSGENLNDSFIIALWKLSLAVAPTRAKELFFMYLLRKLSRAWELGENSERK